jgi:hypothetical protein
MFNTIKKAAQNALGRMGWKIAAAKTIPNATPSLIINNVEVRPIERQTQDIKKWRNALISAEGYIQQRYPLYDLYSEVLLDGFLATLIAKRIAAITNTPLTFQIEGEVQDDIVALTQKSFFADLVREILNARFYGHSLIDLQWQAPNSDKPSQTVLVPRKHVKPRYGIVIKSQWDTEGVDYRAKPYSDTCIEIGEPEDLGILLMCCPYVIYKRGNFGDWAEFAEVFGMPFRWATYNNEQSRIILEEALDKAGSAGYVVAPSDANLQFLQHGAQSGTDIFARLNDACNEELSITVLGNSMTTTEAKSSGFAQAKTHQTGQNELHQDDRMFVIRALNELLTPYLEKIGYKTKGGSWGFQETDGLTLTERLDLDIKINAVAPIDQDYWYEKYKVPKGTPAVIEKETKDKPPSGGLGVKKKPSKNLTDLSQYYQLHGMGCNCPSCSSNIIQLDDTFDVNFIKMQTDLKNDFFDKMWQNQIRKNNLHEGMHNLFQSRLMKMAQAGYEKNFQNPADKAEWATFQNVRKNAREFAAAKQQRIIREIEAAKKDKHGNIRTKAEWEANAKSILNRHERYSKAEDDAAFKSANAIRDWKDYQLSAELYPNLKYNAVNDDLVRDTHLALDNAIYPLNSDFWKKFYPPNGWHCRCTVTQTDEAPNEIDPSFEPQEGFDFNAGAEEKLFSDSHPYFSEVREHDLKAIYDQATHFDSKVARAEAQAWAKENLKGTTMTVPNAPAPLIIRKPDIADILHHRHKIDPVGKNNLLYILEEIMPLLRFIAVAPNTKRTLKQTHLRYLYYSIVLNDVEYYFNFYETEVAGQKELRLYGINAFNELENL